MTPAPARRVDPALLVILAGVVAALHVGKLPPAIPVLRDALGLTLVQAGFLLSLVQLAGMALGVVFGVVADTLGSRRSMTLGLVLLAIVSALGGLTQGVAPLMLLRAAEGFGFLLVVLPAPGLVRALVEPHRVSAMIGLWGAYMPFATAMALLFGPPAIDAIGWRGWWGALAAVSAAMAVGLRHALPADATRPAAAASPSLSSLARLRRTLSAPGPWLIALAFAMYSGQWLAVIGFLPSIYIQSGIAGVAAGVLTATVAAANMIGNIGSGRLLQRGAAPSRLLTIGFATMGLAATASFAGSADAGLAPALRYVAVLLFSGVGGLIPATLFALAVRLAPGEGTLATTLGWVQQWSALGQFAGPPLVAAVASAAGGWQWTWVATGACSVLGLLLTAGLSRLVARR
ncbi:MAG TPA: MFS transporter [Caldimonas sp.]|jgi:MFS family permease|nr:MFS transporter [Caldimonas sp.]HEX2541438.1 MFS transporter [Caldimonas sp.]